MLALKKVPSVLSNSVNTDTGGAKENVQIKWVDLTENVRTFFTQGQSKLSVIIRFLYY